jgi:hypothetical protein
LDEIQVDLDKIKASGKKLKHREFLQFVYKEYAPKNSDNKLKEDIKNDGDLKKAYKIGLTHYHPDKNLTEVHGYAWFFIAEQIAKELGRVYGSLKVSDEGVENYYT